MKSWLLAKDAFHDQSQGAYGCRNWAYYREHGVLPVLHIRGHHYVRARGMYMGNSIMVAHVHLPYY
jgi:hypothetical protein